MKVNEIECNSFISISVQQKASNSSSYVIDKMAEMDGSNIYGRQRILYALGLCLSLYAFYVEFKAEHNQEYRAYCDISPSISCTTVFASPYGKSFGLFYYLYGNEKYAAWNPHNGLVGILYYSTFLLTTFLRPTKYLILIQFLGCIISNLLSIYLGYILYFILENLCVLCVTLYVINALSLFEMFLIAQMIQQPDACCRKKLN